MTFPASSQSLDARIGVGILGLIVVAAVAGPVLIGIDPNSIDVTARMQSPSAEHLLGTDSLGRDLLARLLQGARVSLMICLAAVTLATLIGSLIGIVSGYIGGVVDLFAARLIDLFFAIPTLLVAIAVVAALGPSILTTIVAIATAYSPTYARVIRGAVVSVRDRPFVESSRVAGASTSRILRLDIVPAIRPVMIVQSTALVGAALIDEAALGFLGLGVQPPTSSWGSLLSASRDVLLFHPGLALIPGLAVVVTVIASNLIGEGIRAAGDPRLAQRGAEA